ncbi:MULTISPECIES: galactokinase [unclassified Leeuwenhoekiella]|uniref:galactokinase n=1 Tax=unclassified Leeuwenhoekiella TaxID=2615029 RepID=UPI000C6246CD|nr:MULTISPECIES: galactokinase [unclassified Leeuwenhoekiella]MAW96434.1 galactokinase [Leeuwenhoekiella sp.]MBA81321.1 galactokinase [Leeuwenhoekiella sp.]
MQNNVIAQSPEQVAQIGNFKAEVTVNSPGRVNLIGEHTDYNNGFVMPTAIDKSIVFYLKKNKSKSQCSITSLNFDSTYQFDLSKPDEQGEEWTRYIVGVTEEIKKKGRNLSGFECLMFSNLPMGAGISSSAALECGLAEGLNELFSLDLSPLEIVELSQKAEHNYVGTMCGIMDQFASVMSKENHVIQLDCQSLDYILVPFNIEPYALLLLNTNVSHSLSTSEYNVRRNECEQGVKLLQKWYPKINSLRDVKLEQLEAHKSDFAPVIYNRCLYVIEENARVNAAAAALERNDLESFGQLMYGSHDGLQHKYEVSCKELDFLTDFSRNYHAILGCRMMGGGFGGCTINLIHQDFIEEYIGLAKKAYKEEFDINLTAFKAMPADGGKVI